MRQIRPAFHEQYHDDPQQDPPPRDSARNECFRQLVATARTAGAHWPGAHSGRQILTHTGRQQNETDLFRQHHIMMILNKPPPQKNTQHETDASPS